MRIPRVYTSQSLAVGEALQLEPEPSHHLLKVLRMGLGRELRLFNGDGKEYCATIIATAKKSATVSVDQAQEKSKESPLKTLLAIGLSKGDRFEWVLQKATELGVSEIQPLFSERSEVKLAGERLDKKIAAWEKIIIAACEQCQRNTLPKLLAPAELASFLPTCTFPSKFILHHHNEGGLDTSPQLDAVCFLIGPEGGFSDAEVALAQQAEFKALRLGERVLRTETAPIAALSIAQYLWGDLS